MQVGLVGEAAGRLKWSVLGVLSYLALSVAFHTVSLEQQWLREDYTWTDPMLAFFSIHRIGNNSTRKADKTFYATFYGRYMLDCQF